MSRANPPPVRPSQEELRTMDAVYRRGGLESMMAPHVVYAEEQCPCPGCTQRLQAIDFRLEHYGAAVHDPLVRAWWDDTGFAGKCPGCEGWIHFRVKSKRCITPEEAEHLPQLPDEWHQVALIL